MTKKEFWRSASNWGLIVGGALFVVGLIGWGAGFEAKKMGWPTELMHFAVICSAILVTGFCFSKKSGAEGWPYARAVGWIFAMLMFAGIVYGVGRFLMVNFIAREYFDAINAAALENAAAMYAGNEAVTEQIGKMAHWMTNPIVLIVSGIIEMVVKGGVLGLVLAAFFKKNPDA